MAKQRGGRPLLPLTRDEALEALASALDATRRCNPCHDREAVARRLLAATQRVRRRVLGVR